MMGPSPPRNPTRAVIETTGLANPAPILQTLLDRNVLLRGYTPGPVVTTVDAVHGAVALERHPEAVQQVAMADRLLLTKPDLADGAAVLGVLAALNPAARVSPVLNGEVNPRTLTSQAAVGLGLLRGRIGAARFAATSGHAARVSTLTLLLPAPPEFATLANWLGAVAGACGDGLLRVKGIVQVRGQDRPLAVHGVRHVFHPPTLLERWPVGLTASTLVFILDGIDPSLVLDLADAAGLNAFRAGQQECDDAA